MPFSFANYRLRDLWVLEFIIPFHYVPMGPGLEGATRGSLSGLMGCLRITSGAVVGISVLLGMCFLVDFSR